MLSGYWVDSWAVKLEQVRLIFYSSCGRNGSGIWCVISGYCLHLLLYNVQNLSSESHVTITHIYMYFLFSKLYPQGPIMVMWYHTFYSLVHSLVSEYRIQLALDTVCLHKYNNVFVSCTRKYPLNIFNKHVLQLTTCHMNTSFPVIIHFQSKSTSNPNPIHLLYVCWPNPVSIHLQSTFALCVPSADTIDLDSIHINPVWSSSANRS